jgi:hypothetical protein
VPVLKQLRLDYTPKRRKIDEKFSQIMKKIMEEKESLIKQHIAS